MVRGEVRTLPNSDFCFTRYLTMKGRLNIKPAAKLFEDIKHHIHKKTAYNRNEFVINTQ